MFVRWKLGKAIARGDAGTVRGLLSKRPLLAKDDRVWDLFPGGLTIPDKASIVAALLDGGANPHCYVAKGILGQALALNDSELVRVMLRHGLDLMWSERRDEAQKKSPLHVAAGSGYVQTVAVLLEFGADVHARDAQGRTPLGRAMEFQLAHQTQRIHDTIQLLEAHGALLTSEDAMHLKQVKLEIDGKEKCQRFGAHTFVISGFSGVRYATPGRSSAHIQQVHMRCRYCGVEKP